MNVSRFYLSVLTVLLFVNVLPNAAAAAANDFERDRQRMVDEDIVAAGIKNPRVIQSMRDTPRHEFMPLDSRVKAYFDMALAIGSKQTISPPFVVAYMTEQLDPQPTDKVLEIGTGSGYQAAVLSPLAKDVYTIEIVKPLGDRAARTLKRLKYTNVHPRVGDGYQGWPEAAPFDKIIVTCSPEKVPPKLIEQLKEGGRMIVPVGERYQQMLYLFEKKDGKLEQVALLPTLFVPMTGLAESGRQVLPDPTKPSAANGSFEQLVGGDAPAKPNLAGQQDPPGDAAAPDNGPAPLGWHYQRQLKLEESPEAPDGKRFITFSNTEPGRSAQALQGVAIDGRKVHELSVSVWVKAKSVVPGPDEFQLATVGIVFYDENRAETGYKILGPWRDTFDWQQVKEKVRVPIKAREAVIRIGLNGATGQLSLDALRIDAAN